MARRCACGCSARTSSPFATATAGSAWSRNSARIAASRCFSGATRNAGCAASITAGNSTSKATASTSSTSRRSTSSSTRSTSPPIRRSSSAASCGPIWGRPTRCRRRRNSPGPRCREARRHVSKVIEECNWLQALEGGIDTSHAPILHRLLTDNSTRGGIKPSSPFVRGKAPTPRRRHHRLRLSLCRHPAARRQRCAHPQLSFRHAVPSDPAVAVGKRAGDATPATSGCRWMTRTAWSTTGCTRRPTRR